jgi:hypothetical protein
MNATADVPIERMCPRCLKPFTITANEQEYFRELAKRIGGPVTLPARCYPCRAERRREKYVVVDDGRKELLVCITCGVEFVFGGRDRTFFAQSGFSRPRRCRPCRTSEQREAS